MSRDRRRALVLVWLLALCPLTVAFTQGHLTSRHDYSQQSIVTTTVCALRGSPQSYSGKQVRVDVYLNLAFEDVSIHDPACLKEDDVDDPSSAVMSRDVWVEFADEVHPEDVKGYAPLVENEQLLRLQDVISERGGLMPRATLIGTFYAAKPPEKAEPGQTTFLSGYGHMGCCHLFVVSQVESVEMQYAANLDYSFGAGTGIPGDCYAEEETDPPKSKEIRSWQTTVNAGEDSWRYDSFKVAEDQLKRMQAAPYPPEHSSRSEIRIPEDSEQSDFPLSYDVHSTETLLEVQSSPYRKSYEFIARDRKTRLVIVVARPFWLEKLAGSPNKVIWVPVSSSYLECVAPGEHLPRD
jgi:hypothetical protein